LAVPYACPICKANRTHFELIHKIAREIHKDPSTGETVYLAPELETLSRGGRPETDVRCLHCGYTGSERLFIRAALR